MKYDKEAGMERDVLNARPFQRYMPSKHLLQLFDENIDQCVWSGFKLHYPGMPYGAQGLCSNFSFKIISAIYR